MKTVRILDALTLATVLVLVGACFWLIVTRAPKLPTCPTGCPQTCLPAAKPSR